MPRARKTPDTAATSQTPANTSEREDTGSTDQGETRAAHEEAGENREPGTDRGTAGESTADQPPPPRAAAFWLPIASLQPWAENPRTIKPEAVAKVRASILANGWGAPLIAHTPSGTIVAGHTRRLALLDILASDPAYVLPGAEKPGEVPVRFAQVRKADGVIRFATWEECEALALADNRTAEEGVWDQDRLARIMRSMKEREPAADLMSRTGFDTEQVRRLVLRARHGAKVDLLLPEPSKVPKVPASRAGEIYELGPHRLLCGDSCDLGAPGDPGATPPVPPRLSAWRRLLLDGERISLVWTDPPYGIAYVGGSHAVMNPAERQEMGGMTLDNDELDPAALKDFLERLLRPLLEACEPGASWYVAAPAGPLHNIFGEVLGPAPGMDVWRRSLIWLKDVFVFGRGDYHYRHEPIFYGWKPGAGHKWQGPTNADTILIYPRPRSSKLHPTMKPVELVRDGIRNSSEHGGIVADPCGGSGTTLMACAAEGRICRTIELAPGYCDVIRDRYTRWAEKAGLEVGSGALRLPR